MTKEPLPHVEIEPGLSLPLFTYLTEVIPLQKNFLSHVEVESGDPRPVSSVTLPIYLDETVLR